jgi:thiamine-monophosphate kinase
MLALPDQVGDDWLSGFAHALGADAEQYSCPLLGGDTVHIPGPTTISIAAFGALPHGRMVMRHGAKPGDRVVITGTIGDAALGVLLKRDPATRARWRINRQAESHLISRYLVPQPRNAIASALLGHASAAMDVSDGLVGDLTKLCGASSVSAEIDVARVPLSDAARGVLATAPGLIDTVLTGGDDYEVLASVPPEKLASLEEAAAAAGVALTTIGKVIAGEGVARFLDEQGKPLAFACPSFSHF